MRREEIAVCDVGMMAASKVIKNRNYLTGV